MVFTISYIAARLLGIINMKVVSAKKLNVCNAVSVTINVVDEMFSAFVF